MTGVPQIEVKIETINEEDVSRRSFLQTGSACLAGGLLLPKFIHGQLDQQQLDIQQLQENDGDRMWGIAMAYGGGRLDLIDLDNAKLLHSFEGIRATHAITPIESLNRFVIHGHRADSQDGAVVVFQVDPVKKTWEVILNEELPGGPALHWQPNPQFTEICLLYTSDAADE